MEGTIRCAVNDYIFGYKPLDKVLDKYLQLDDFFGVTKQGVNQIPGGAAFFQKAKNVRSARRQAVIVTSFSVNKNCFILKLLEYNPCSVNPVCF